MAKAKDTPTKRQYVIFYRRGDNPRWGQLEPIVNEGLYKRPEVALAVAFIQTNLAIEGVCVRLGDDVFNIMVLIAGNPSHDPTKAFPFIETTSELVLPEGT